MYCLCIDILDVYIFILSNINIFKYLKVIIHHNDNAQFQFTLMFIFVFNNNNNNYYY